MFKEKATGEEVEAFMEKHGLKIEQLAYFAGVTGNAARMWLKKGCKFVILDGVESRLKR